MQILSIHYDDPHPVHKAWFEEVGEVKKLEIDNEPSLTNILRYALKARKLDNKYDLIICEGGVELRTAVVKKLLNWDLKIIRLIADEGIYECESGGKGCKEIKITHRFLDGAIANSKLMKEYAEEVVPCNIDVVTPYVPRVRNLLDIEKNNYDTGNILFIGYNNHHKGIDKLVEAVKGLDQTLHIVGEGHKNYSQDNIVTHGWLDDLEGIMAKCDLYVHPARVEAFGVAPAEAIAAGIPAILTKNTGLKDHIQINDNLVADSDPDDIRVAIEYYYSISVKERREIAEKMRNSVSGFTRKSSEKEFNWAITKIFDIDG